MQRDSQLACRLSEAIDHIGIEPLQRTRITMHYLDLSARTGRYVREFEGDVSAANEQNSSRKMI